MATTDIARRRLKRLYSVDERALILATLDANHGNIKGTATQFGIRDSTVRRIIQDAQRDTERARRVRALRDAKRGDLTSQFDDLAWQAAQQVADKLPEASARDAAVCLGIAVDKAQLLRGMPTQIVGHLDSRLAKLNDDQLDQIEKWLDEADRQQPCQIDATTPVDIVKCADVTDTSGRETVQADPERAGDARRALQGRRATAAEQPGDGALRQPAPPREVGRADPLVGEHGPQAGGERAGG